MKCEVCGRSITINWGNNYAVVCEEHRDHIDELQAKNLEKVAEWKEAVAQHIPAEVAVTTSKLLNIWWAFTWRYVVALIVIGGAVERTFHHSLSSLYDSQLITIETMKAIQLGVAVIVPLVCVFLILQRLLGKKIGDVRLVLVSTKPNDNN